MVGITNTASGFNNCHRHLPELITAVERGVLAAGGLPISFPTISLGEPFVNPTSLMFRNLMSMDVEEMVRAQPMDAVVLVGGCDKTVPALLMGALAADRPAVLLVAGPMMTSRHRDERLGACTDCRRFWAQYRAGTIERAEIDRIETRLATTAGTCPVMGTASTMACIAETLGMTLPGTAAIPAVHADRLRAAEASGGHAVRMARGGPRPREVVTQAAVDNALRVLLAIGGSTNGILHLAAIAGRAGLPLSLDTLNRVSDETPVLVDLKPTGPHYMEDFFAAGGIGAVLRELRPLLGSRGADGDRRDAGRAARQRHELGRPRRDPAARRAAPAAGRTGGAVRQPGAGRCHPETLGGGRDAVRARGPRGGVHEPRGSVGADRRSRSRRDAGRRAGAAERRAEERQRHARGGLPADPRQARARRASRT